MRTRTLDPLAVMLAAGAVGTLVWVLLWALFLWWLI